ncbi:MAG TPA: class I SAM-dependent methyltransferase [Streptosporangiaceae bacterium]|nr:class I SAM-dependent methyltransferase [Streptosporangiaceae bacterium]
MTTSTMTIAATRSEPVPAAGPSNRQAGDAGIACAIDRYLHAQSEFSILPEPARYAILEIGDGLEGLREAITPLESRRGEAPRADTASESLVASALNDAVAPHLAVLEREIGFPDPATWRVASRYFHERFGPLVDLSPFAARCFHKPLGYAGDFEMMNMVYRNESVGRSLFGRSLSRIVLDSDAARAVRNRTDYLTAKIEAAVARAAPDQPARILSVAAGPAMEIQRILQRDAAMLAADRAEIVLLDQDAGALDHATGQIRALAAAAGVKVKLRCINTSIRTVIADGLHGSYDLVYSAGLFDYLRDRTARAAGARIVEALAPGGTAVIGNFAVANPTRPLMELVLDWALIHRSPDDLRCLFGDLGNGMTIEREAAGVNLFAVIRA